MKGLTLTLQIVIVAIVLLVTALVVLTIFGGSIAQFLGILNPWSETILQQNSCNSRCASWCQGHIGSAEESWANLKVQTASGEKSCSEIMSGISEKCLCRGLMPTCSLKCMKADAGKTLTGQSTCASGKTCQASIACPAADAIPDTGYDVSGTCK